MKIYSSAIHKLDGGSNPNAHREWMNVRGSVWYVTTAKYHSAIKTRCWHMLQRGWTKKALRSVEEARRNRSRTVLPFTWSVQSRWVPRHRKQRGSWRGRGRIGSDCLVARGLLLGCWQPRLAWVSAEAVVVHHCECATCRRPGHSRWLISCHVNFTSI